jgi:Protein of unknown function (DUF3592)
MRHFDLWTLLNFWWEIALTLMALLAGVRAWFRAREAQSWLSVHGTAASSRVHSTSGHYKSWVAELTYSYIVNGEYYSGAHHVRAWRQKRAQEIGEGWKGRTIVVRYSQAKPEVSVLLRDDQPGGQLGVDRAV